MVKTEAWVLSQERGFALEEYEFNEPGGDDCLVEPLYGCWEGNFSHAVARVPIDVCKQRGEQKIVLGNSGVVRVLKPGRDVKGFHEGDVCLLFGSGTQDRYGYMKLAHAYDLPNSMGILAKRATVPAKILMPIPHGSSFSLAQWAAFSLRYITAWSNHRLAYGAWRLQIPEDQYPEGFPVWAWGGGVAFAQLQLAKMKDRARGVLITSHEARREMAVRAGLEALDRSQYPALSFDQSRFDTDPEYAARYRDSEKRFLQEVKQRTDGEGVAIFIDNIGTPVFRATLKALARQGVVATCGWKHGMRLELFRAIECITRHTYVHTHYANRREGDDAVRFACEHGWMVPAEALGEFWEWDQLGKLATDHLAEKIDSYFPIFRISPE